MDISIQIKCAKLYLFVIPKEILIKKSIIKLNSISKRIIDISFSIIALICLLPLIVILSTIIVMSSQGGIIYKQVRIGKNGMQYQLYKFRSMFKNSENKTGPIWALVGDKRITPIGKIMRKYHLDEIPQFVNVLIGQMSLVGPRPERPKIIRSLIKEIPNYTHRLTVKPGITGWAQIMGNYDTTLEDVNKKLKNDLYYIENISIMFDFKIIFLTMWIIMRGSGQ